MAINPINLASLNVLESDTDVVIEMLNNKPISTRYYDIATTPNKLCGYYNPETEKVELFVTDYTGRRYLKVG